MGVCKLYHCELSKKHIFSSTESDTKHKNFFGRNRIVNVTLTVLSENFARLDTKKLNFGVDSREKEENFCNCIIAQKTPVHIM